MIPCRCLVQAGQVPDRRQSELRSLLNDFSARSFGKDADISWVPVAAGCGFTASKPSTSSVVAFTAPTPLDQSTRVKLLSEICDLWMAQTGCSLNEIVAVISDPP